MRPDIQKPECKAFNEYFIHATSESWDGGQNSGVAATSKSHKTLTPRLDVKDELHKKSSTRIKKSHDILGKLVFLLLGTTQLLGYLAIAYSLKGLETSFSSTSNVALLACCNMTILVLLASCLLFLDCTSRFILYSGTLNTILGPVLYALGVHFVESRNTYPLLVVASCSIGAGCCLMMLYSMAYASNMPTGNYNSWVCNGIGLSGLLSFAIYAIDQIARPNSSALVVARSTSWILAGCNVVITVATVILFERLLRTSTGQELQRRLQVNRSGSTSDENGKNVAKESPCGGENTTTTTTSVSSQLYPLNRTSPFRAGSEADRDGEPRSLKLDAAVQEPKNVGGKSRKSHFYKFRFLNQTVFRAGWFLSFLGLLSSLTTNAIYPGIGPLQWYISAKNHLRLLPIFGCYQIFDVLGRYAPMFSVLAFHTKGVALMTFGRMICVVPFYLLGRFQLSSLYPWFMVLELALIAILGLTNGWISTASMQHLPDLVSRPSDKGKIVSLGLLLGFSGGTAGYWVSVGLVRLLFSK